ncbi:MAG: hypothetical protein AAF489_16045, partial [Bacteroidota bacterium]
MVSISMNEMAFPVLIGNLLLKGPLSTMISLQTTLTTYLSDAFETYGVEREFGKVVISQRPELSQFQ